MSPVPYETFEHGADVGVRGFGFTLEEAFENAALAMFSVMLNVDAVTPQREVSVACSAFDTESLLTEWLNALLSTAHLKRMAFSRFRVRIQDDALTGTAWGEPLDPARHMPEVEVKAATYSELRVYKDPQGRHVAQCVVDV